MRAVRSEGHLATNVGSTGLTLPLRRRGLTTAEKFCMRAVPTPSPKFVDKVAVWCSDAGKNSPGKKPLARRARTQSEPAMYTLPSENATPRRLSEVATSDSSIQTACRGSADDVPSPQHANHLSTKEELCDRIIKHIYPATLTGLGFHRSCAQWNNDARSDITPRPSRRSYCSTSSLRRRRSRRSLRETNSNKEVDSRFDVSAASPIGANAIRLIEGAAATRENYEAIREDMLSNTCLGQRIIFDHHAKLASLHVVRQTILDTYSSIQEAFHSINVEHDGDLDKREWCSVLSALKWCTLGEARAVYDLMDADHDGTLTPTEFQVGIEIVAQVNSMENMRKRLICVGFRTMMEAIMVMNGGGTHGLSQPLSLREFSMALRRVWILEPQEHRAIFNSVRDPSDVTCRASLVDLALALAVVSPSLILEDFRVRMLDDTGSLQAALQVLSPQESIGLESFKQNAYANFGICEQKAEKLFKMIDLDAGGEVSQDEIKRALDLAEPSLDLEECRHKLRQGYQTIKVAFSEAYASPEEVGLPSAMHFTVNEFNDVLGPLQLGRRNVRRLVRLMGQNDHGVTLDEFWSGARLFAPSCALEELKLQLLEVHRSLEVAFQQVKDKRAPLNRRSFETLLQTLGVHCDGADEIFDFLVSPGTGHMTTSNIIAALQCLQTGSQKILSPVECRSKAERDAHQIFNPVLQYASDLRKHFRENVADKEPASLGAPEQGTGHRRSSKGDAGSWPVAKQVAAPRKVLKLGPARLKPHMVQSDTQIPRHILARRTFQKISSTLHVLPPAREEKNMLEFGTYFGSAEHVLGEQRPLLKESYNRVEDHHAIEKLKRAESIDDHGLERHASDTFH